MSRLSTWIDAWMAAGPVARYRQSNALAAQMRWVQTSAGVVRVFDSGDDKPCVVMTPDGPNVIEHYAGLFALLTPHLRVVCFDMPGFGFSAPSSGYDHSLDQGAAAIIELLDQLHVPKATLAMSCANGFYALRVARLAPQRITHLVLSQTPSMQAMHRWTDRVVPTLLKLPLVGQLVSRLFRQKMAASWYRIALSKATDATPYQQASHRALRCGGCFSLAGVVQGLLRESVDATLGTHMPCTVLWGTQDRSHRVTDPQAVLRDVPHAEVIVFDDCGHFPDLESPQRFAQILLTQVTRVVSVKPELQGVAQGVTNSAFV
jgi:pimeloyl-ACP methyl ester carboxylesterase